MVLLYILLIAYILAVNFYAYLLVKSMRDKEKERATNSESLPNVQSSTATVYKESLNQENATVTTNEKVTGKLCITGALGGAITIYVCMFVLKYKRSDLLLMVVMPLLGVLNVYLWVLLFRSGFSFFLIK